MVCTRSRKKELICDINTSLKWLWYVLQTSNYQSDQPKHTILVGELYTMLWNTWSKFIYFLLYTSNYYKSSFFKCVKSSEKPDTSATILAMEPKVLKFPRIWLSDTKVILKIAVILCYTKDLGTFSRRNTWKIKILNYFVMMINWDFPAPNVTQI